MCGGRMNQENGSKQNIFITQRQRAHLECIEEVESFTDTEIVALSSLGRLIVEGEELHIDAFSTDTGEMEIHGKINGVFYLDEKTPVKKGFFSRLTR